MNDRRGRMANMKMMKTVTVLVLGVLLLPRPAHAWGGEAHQFIMDRTIALLPAELRPLDRKSTRLNSSHT